MAEAQLGAAKIRGREMRHRAEVNGDVPKITGNLMMFLMMLMLMLMLMLMVVVSTLDGHRHPIFNMATTPTITTMQTWSPSEHGNIADANTSSTLYAEQQYERERLDERRRAEEELRAQEEAARAEEEDALEEDAEQDEEEEEEEDGGGDEEEGTLDSLAGNQRCASLPVVSEEEAVSQVKSAAQ
eukprot:2310640-Rhodomonas_salina.1